MEMGALNLCPSDVLYAGLRQCCAVHGAFTAVGVVISASSSSASIGRSACPRCTLDLFRASAESVVCVFYICASIYTVSSVGVAPMQLHHHAPASVITCRSTTGQRRRGAPVPRPPSPTLSTSAPPTTAYAPRGISAARCPATSDGTGGAVAACTQRRAQRRLERFPSGISPASLTTCRSPDG